MKILLIGGGGREHAIAWKIKQDNPDVQLFVSPGNGGTAQLAENVALNGKEAILEFAKNKSIDLCIVGPEAELVEGIVDDLASAGVSAFGPHKAAAQLEGSKAFAKAFMKKYGVKTASYSTFSDYAPAKEYIQNQSYPLVIKASGLAAGKGVIIAKDLTEAEQALQQIMLDKSFGAAGDEVVVEEFLEGFEASIISIFNGKEIYCFPAVKDHKKIGEGETGLNTGGMGVVAPNPWFKKEHQQLFEDQILQPTLHGLNEEKLNFSGVIFFGLMCTPKGVYLLEYNLRFGDPETQALLPLMDSNLLETIQKSINGEPLNLQVKNETSCCLVLVSGGYPEAYEKHKTIEGLNNLDILHFVAGAEFKNNEFITSGGRVLNLVAVAKNLNEAREKVYAETKKIQFKNMYFRKDIGL